MLNIESINYSLRNLKHRKGRSFLTVFSILIGIATIFIFISFGYGLYNYVDEMSSSSSADKLLIMPRGGAFGVGSSVIFNDDDLNEILKTPGIEDAAGMYFKTVQISNGKEQIYSFLTSFDPQKNFVLEIFNVGIAKGRLLQKGDRGVVVGYDYSIDGKIFDEGLEVNDKIEIDGEKFKIIGFLESIGTPRDDSQVYITNDYYLELYPNTTSYAQIIAVAEDINNLERTVEDVEKNLRKHRELERGKEDFFVQTFEDMINSFSNTLDIIIGFVILIALISVIVSAVNTANTMITSVLERYKEIGILKAIGARNSEIFGIFLFESAFLGLIAGILGVLLGWGMTSIMGKILMNLGWAFLQPYYNFIIFGGLILFAVLTGAISGVAPAIRAAKINTVDALRYE
jgi:putative ABC transport system permease protein